MKLFIVLAAVTVAQAAKLDRVYLPSNAEASAGSGNFLQSPNYSSNGYESQSSNGYSGGQGFTGFTQNGLSSVEGRPERPQAARERNAAILRQDFSNNGDSYSYSFETENGIQAEQNGVAAHGVQAQGGYSYTGDDGKVYSVRYTADVNGFVPQGDHLPTPPPIPEEILKGLELIARAQAAGTSEGSYPEANYSGNDQQQFYNTNAQPINYNSGAVDKSYLPPSN